MSIKNDLIVSPYNMGSTNFLFFYLTKTIIPNIEKYKNKENQEFNILFFCDNEDTMKFTFGQFEEFLKTSYNGVYNIEISPNGLIYFGKESIKSAGEISFKRLKSNIYNGMVFSVDVTFLLFDVKNKINNVINNIGGTNVIISVLHDLKHKKVNNFILDYVINKSSYVIGTHIIRENYTPVYDYLFAKDNMLVNLINRGFSISFYSDVMAVEEEKENETIIL
jgi:hypothetical protein